MKSRLKYWQAFLLMLPAIAGGIIDDLPQANTYDSETAFAIANCLLMFNICLVIYWQTAYALGFNNQSAKRSGIFTFNALIPATFSTVYFLILLYRTFVDPNIHINHLDGHLPGPIQPADFNFKTWLVVGLLIHALLTFLFINNGFVAIRIKKVPDEAERLQLRARYLKPMRVLRTTAIIVFVLTIVIDATVEIIKRMA